MIRSVLLNNNCDEIQPNTRVRDEPKETPDNCISRFRSGSYPRRGLAYVWLGSECYCGQRR